MTATDRLNHWAQAVAMGAVAGFAAVISYNHIADLGLRYGGTALTARLLPLSVDGLILAASLLMLADARAKRSVHWLTWAGLMAGVAATVAANCAYGLRFGVAGAILWAWPALAFVVAAELSMIMVRRTSVAPETHPDAPESEVHLRSVPEEVPSLRAIMREKRVGRPRAREIRAELMARTA